MSDELNDFGLPGRSLDDFLAEEFRGSADETSSSTDGEKNDKTYEDGTVLFPGIKSPEYRLDVTGSVEHSELPSVENFDPDADRELTLYGVMRLAAEAAVDAVSGYKLSPQADAFRAYLVSFRNELRQ